MSWTVCENVAKAECREFEFSFDNCGSILGKKYIRVYPDGRIELGEKHSDFKAEYTAEIKE